MFSEFRDLMDKWDRAKALMVESDLCLFFRKGGRLYGAGENSRITFARMKNPESKEDADWKKDATFTAYDLEKEGNSMSVFSAVDLPEISVVSQDEAQKSLKKKGKSLPEVDDDREGGRSIGEE